MSLRVTILGSGTIIPTPGRRATSLVIARDGELFLFDCGPGALDALTEAGLTFRDLNRVFLTHFHPDHTLGLGHLLAALRVDDATDGRRELTLFGPSGLAVFIERWHALYHSTEPKGVPPELCEVENGEVYNGGGVRVRAVEVDHEGQPALAYRFESDGASVVYTGDTAYTESLVELARGADLLVTECSFPDDRPMAGHMTPSAVDRLASRSGAGRVVLVHMYPVFAEQDPATPVRRKFKGLVTVAGDGMIIEL